MAFVGNRQGPRESDIVRRLGASYFGITEEALESEIADYKFSEQRGWITPVRQDPDGRYYILFSAPHGKEQLFYLDENGLALQGEVRIWDPNSPIVEVKP